MPDSSESGPITRRLEALVRGAATPRWKAWPRQPVSAVSEEPSPDVRVERTMRIIGWALAPVTSLVVGAVLVALRSEIDRSTAALILVLPVVLVAVIGGPGPAALAAIMAPLTFDVLLTRPYYRLQIHAVEDVEATVILLIVGMLVGQLVAREVRSRIRSTTRQAEVQAMSTMVAAMARQDDVAELADEAVAVLTQLLNLRECRWQPGYHGGAYPELARDGEIIRHGPGRTLDRASLPQGGVELPVRSRSGEEGRFLLVPARRTVLSREERRVAVAIADLFAIGMDNVRQRGAAGGAASGAAARRDAP